MRVLTKFMEFEEEVKMFEDYWRLRDMGLTSATSLNGIFTRSEADELRDFCGENPQFHIVSFCPKSFAFNRFHPDGYAFYLAEGNPDPNLLLDWRIEADEIWDEGFLLEEP